jgi:hypothetical protein
MCSCASASVRRKRWWQRGAVGMQAIGDVKRERVKAATVLAGAAFLWLA